MEGFFSHLSLSQITARDRPYSVSFALADLGMAAHAVAAAAHAVREKRRAESKERADELRESILKIFDKYDADGNGNIDQYELGLALADLGLEVPRAALKGIMVKYCKRGANSLDINTFETLVRDLNGHIKQTEAKATKLASLSEPFVAHSILGKNKPLPWQAKVRSIYMHPICVWVVAGFIVGNFVVNIVEKEIDPDINDIKFAATWDQLDVIFNIVFLIELLMNLYGYGGPVCAFWKSPWNVFDFFIVTVGVLLMTPLIPPDSPAGKLKLLRAFRVFRLFKRIKSLNKIIVALIGAIPGVINAFVVMFIFFCIYAILAVELFRDFGRTGEYNTTGSPDDDGFERAVSSETTRGMTNGYEYYGSFMRAMFSLFQVMTGESWSEAIARPLIFGDQTLVVGIFYISFIILTQIVLTNVVVAVLLDKFVTTNDDADDVGSDKNGLENGGGISADAVSSFLDGIPEEDSMHGSPTEYSSTQGSQSRDSSRYSSPLQPAFPVGDATSKRLEAVEASITALQATMQSLHSSIELLLGKLDKAVVAAPVLSVVPTSDNSD